MKLKLIIACAVVLVGCEDKGGSYNIVNQYYSHTAQCKAAAIKMQQDYDSLYKAWDHLDSLYAYYEMRTLSEKSIVENATDIYTYAEHMQKHQYFLREAIITMLERNRLDYEFIDYRVPPPKDSCSDTFYPFIAKTP